MRIKKILSNTSREKFFARRGQVMALFALLIPIILLFVGLTLDLGWYYLNVSRLQNAADAAAVAGARSIINNNSSKLKNLTPVLVHLPQENNTATESNDEDFPKTTTETTTETKNGVTTTTTVTTTENADGSTVVNTVTVTEDSKGTKTTTTNEKTSTPTYSDIDTTKGHLTARKYLVKNLGETQNIQADADETVNLIIDKWNTFKETLDRKVDTDLNFIERNGSFYYTVELTENIRHFFLSGWFDSMEAKVVAYALLDKKSSTDVNTFEEFIEKLEEAKNKNVIVGNWEVQNYYRYINSKDGTVILVDDDGNPILDESGNVQTVKAKRSEEYSEIYTSDYDKSVGITREVYTSSWNEFQDYYVHFEAGTPIRYETIDVFDDVVLVDPNLTGAARYAENNMQSYGKIDNGYVKNPTANGSSVKKNVASSNGNDTTSYTYNAAGNPYAWQDLDSIDVDFQPEVGWNTSKSVYPLQDWDLKLGYDGEMSGTKYGQTKHEKGTGNSNVGVGAVMHYAYNQDGSEKSNKKLGGWHDHLRIHSYINFKTPYPTRSIYEKSDANDTDVLWVRIESEPMFRYPDSKDSRKQIKNHLDIAGLNAVRQIFINFVESNTEDDERPVVIFYDGPERYSTNNSIRDSLPIVVNFAAPVRAIIYVPNSPVVVIGNHKDDFRGFIVAKKFLRLKETADFEAEIGNYDKSDDKGNILDDSATNYNYRAKVETDNPYWGVAHSKADGTVVNYRDNGEPKKINWLYKKITYSPTTKDGKVVGEFDMYVDDYGNVQYMDYPNAPKRIGKYSTLGKTDLTTHNYHIEKELSNNMIESGVRFNYEINGYETRKF